MLSSVMSCGKLMHVFDTDTGLLSFSRYNSDDNHQSSNYSTKQNYIMGAVRGVWRTGG